MDLDVAWVMEAADTVPFEEFEEWYAGRHTEVAKRLPGLRRYALSRLVDDGLLDAPDGLGGVHRVAQLVWADAAAAEAAFTSYDGMAAFGDNALGTGSGAYTKAVGLTWDRPLDVLHPAIYDVVTGAFRRVGRGADGLPAHGVDPHVVRVLAYGFGGDPADPEGTHWDPLRADPRVRGLVVGQRLGRPLELGRLRVPADGVLAAGWSWEAWFDSVEDARAVLASPAAEESWRAWTAGTPRVFRGIFASQEIFQSRAAV